MSIKHKKAVKLIFFIGCSYCSIIFSGECPFCKNEVVDHNNLACIHCDSTLSTVIDTLRGENNLFQGSLLIGESSDEPCCTVEEAIPLRPMTPLLSESASAIEGIAMAAPYSLPSVITKFAAPMVHTLLQNLKSPSCKVLSEEQHRGTLLLETTDPGVLSVNIGISELQPVTNLLAEGLHSLTTWFGGVSTNSNWELMLDTANDKASQKNKNTLYWVESSQQWIFINITPDGNELTMLIWNWYCQDEVNHYALFKFDDIESVRSCLRRLLEDRNTSAGYH